MPEGPEILFFSVFLKQKFIKSKISDVKSYVDPAIILPTDFEGSIVDISSKGKLLWIKVTSNTANKYYYVHIHFGLDGWILFENPKDFVKYELKLETNNKQQIIIYLEDKTRLSKLKICEELEHHEILNKLGVEIFKKEFTLEKFSSVIKHKNMMLASFLLKQDLFCGIGNYIKNEVLYMSKLPIKVKTRELSDVQIAQLYKNILFVAYSSLMEQLENQKIKEYLGSEYKINIPDKLEVPYTYKIYRRTTTDEGKKIIKIKIGGRDTYTIEE
jgi:endonuclease-8